MTVLDNPAWHALTTRHAHLAAGSGAVRRYEPGVSVFWAVERHEPDAWAALPALAAPSDTNGERVAIIMGPDDDPMPDWPVAWRIPGFQMVLDELVPARVPADARLLGTDDIDEMSALVELTKPGPFRPRTIEMGEYLGVVRDGRLVAMAGQRMAVDGYREVSAVATHPDAQGQGLAAGLSTMVAQRSLEQGDVPFLHVVGTNVGAIRVYERLGFRIRRPFVFTSYELPSR